jgi:hypothetical protein
MKSFHSIIIIVLLVHVSCTQPQTFENEQLSFINQFGNEGVIESLINRAGQIELNNKGEIFIPDETTATIKIYDSSGNYLRSYGRKGRGPGEFSGGFFIDTRNDTVVTYDRSNYSVNFHTEKGEFISTFTVNNSFTGPFKFIEGKKLITADKASAFSIDLQNESLFHVFDFEGNLIHQFGEFPIIETDTPARVYRHTFEVIDNKLHVLFAFLPIYQIYDLNDFSLIKSIDLTEFETFHTSFSDSDVSLTRDEIVSNKKGLSTFAGLLDAYENNAFFFQNTEEDDALVIRRFKIVDDSLSFIERIDILKGDDIFSSLDLTYDPSNNILNILNISRSAGFVVNQYKLK